MKHPLAIQLHLFYKVYTLDRKHIQYLRAIENHPDMRPVDRDELLGFDRIGGEQIHIRKRLGGGGPGILGLNLIREVLVPGGENTHDHTKLVLTNEGCLVLSREKS